MITNAHFTPEITFSNLSQFSLEYKCRAGYEQKNGSLGGSEKEVLKSLHRINPYDCERKCDYNPDCMSYTYSSDWQKCKLQTVPDPLKNTENHRDYVWCTKSINDLEYSNYSIDES